MQVVGEAANGREAVVLARTLQPDVILMDMLMPEMDGPAAITLITQENPNARILVLTSFGERDQVSLAIHAGALGYLLKNSTPDDLFHAIRSVYPGQPGYTPGFSHRADATSAGWSRLRQTQRTGK